ncbi:MAG TPA: DUF5752 family protein [Anaerolineales bacterium]
MTASHPFAVIDCAMLSIATGVSAQNLRELRDRLRSLPASSLYFHFWGAHLRPGFEEPEYNNDFALWAKHGLNDLGLAERLSVIDPPSFGDLEALREELVEVVEQRLYEREYIPWAPSDREFHFIRAILVVLDTGMRIKRPEALAKALPQLSPSSLFYHFIDARRRPPEGIDDFRAWLADFGDRYQRLIERITDIDPTFITLTRLQRDLSQAFAEHLPRGKA